MRQGRSMLRARPSAGQRSQEQHSSTPRVVLKWISLTPHSQQPRRGDPAGQSEAGPSIPCQPTLASWGSVERREAPQTPGKQHLGPKSLQDI